MKGLTVGRNVHVMIEWQGKLLCIAALVVRVLQPEVGLIEVKAFPPSGVFITEQGSILHRGDDLHQLVFTGDQANTAGGWHWIEQA